MWLAYSRRVSAGVLVADSVQARAVEVLSRLADACGAAAGQARGVYMHGGVGRGKTMLMDLFHDELPEASRRRGVMRTHFHPFMKDMHASLHRDVDLKRAVDPVQAFAEKLVASSPLLLFDEVEISDIGDAMLLKRLLSQYWARGGTLVATSNAAPSELYRGGLNYAVFQPLVGELVDRCEVLDLTASPAVQARAAQARIIRQGSSAVGSMYTVGGVGAGVGSGVDYRRVEGAVLPPHPVLFFPTAAAEGLQTSPAAVAETAEQGALAAWRAYAAGTSNNTSTTTSATQGAVTANEAVNVPVAMSSTRNTTVPRVRGVGGVTGVAAAGRGAGGAGGAGAGGRAAAWFTFASLCGAESSLSAADYLVLADRFDLFGVSPVPRFTLQNESEARRFVSLVDVLYDRRALLVAALAAPPDSLFAISDADGDGDGDGGGGGWGGGGGGGGVDESVAGGVMSRPPAGRTGAGDDRARVGWEGQVHDAAGAFAVLGEGGSSGRATTVIGGMEWSATGTRRALAHLQRGSFVFRAAPRCVSRLIEMSGSNWCASWVRRRTPSR
jgi:predicted ATPase